MKDKTVVVMTISLLLISSTLVIAAPSKSETIDSIDSSDVEWSYENPFNIYAVDTFHNESDNEIYTYIGDSTDHHVKKIDSTGSEVWTFDGHDDTVKDISVDEDGYIYSASADDSVKKIDTNGSEIWSYEEHSDYVQGVTVDGDYVYSVGDDGEVHKIDKSGNQVWNCSINSGYVDDVAVDDNEYVYAGGSDNNITKLNSSGSEVWTFTGHTDTVLGVTVGPEGYIYSASADDSVKKIDPNGSKIWTYDGHDYDVYGLDTDQEGNIYTASADHNVTKLNSSGSEIWTFSEHTEAVRDVSVDITRYVYSVSKDNFLYKIEQSSSNTESPDAPMNPSPEDGATDVSTSPTLSVDISDSDGDMMDVTFYDVSDDSEIGKVTNQSNGTVSVEWSNLNHDSNYSWYVVVDDGFYSNRSSNFTFTTESPSGGGLLSDIEEGFLSDIEINNYIITFLIVLILIVSIYYVRRF